MADQQMKHFQRSMTMDLSAERVFAFVSEIGNLPKYLPPITSAEATGPESIHLSGSIPSTATLRATASSRSTGAGS